MPLKIYNTLTKKKEVFKPLKKGKVSMYVCGPTVNGVPHLGHARSQVTFDVIRRFFEFTGLKVTFVSNITDIEDKIINESQRLGKNIKAFSLENEKLHKEDYEMLHVKAPDVQPHATEYVAEMIDLIKRLEKKGFTYIIEEDGVYYDLEKYDNFGKLSGQKSEDLLAGKRIANDNKKNPKDFVLWKFSKPKEPQWDSPWGKGRPGWHIECSAMSHKILGSPFDIHGGGQDLIFPHHEDEIAQSEVGYGKKMANYWVHNGLVNVNGEKMSKSLHNFKTIRDLLEDYSPEVIRYFILSAHYRKPLDFSKQALDDAQNSYNRLKNIVLSTLDDGKENKKTLKEFEKVLLDDINTPNALAVLWTFLRDSKATGKIATVKKMDEIFGLNLLEKNDIKIPSAITKLADERLLARNNKDWKLSDSLREKILKKGWNIRDTKEDYILEKL